MKPSKASSSLLCKLFDKIISEKHEDNLISDDLQFGYKKQCSTIACTSLLLNTVEYYRENDSDCYMLLLNASKAFDGVEYVNCLVICESGNSVLLYYVYL